MVFSGFTPDDEGRSRQLVAEMADRNSDNAALFVALRNALPALIEYVCAVEAGRPSSPLYLDKRAALLAALGGRHE